MRTRYAQASVKALTDSSGETVCDGCFAPLTRLRIMPESAGEPTLYVLDSPVHSFPGWASALPIGSGEIRFTRPIVPRT